MTSSCDIRVSIDVGCHSHSVAIGLASSDLLDEFAEILEQTMIVR
jgi:hypothetical protein